MDGPQAVDKVVLNEDSDDVFIRGMMQSLVSLTRASNSLPSAEGNASDYGYFQTFRECSTNMGSLSDEVANLIRELCFFSRAGSGSKLLSADLLDATTFESVIDIVDDLLEHADIKLDEAAGIDVSKRAHKLKEAVDRERVMYSSSLELPKPQEKFDTAVDNGRESAFSPVLWGKPNCIVPLEKSINNTTHLYEPEISLLDYETMITADAVPSEPFAFPAPCESHPFEYIDTEPALRDLARTLKISNYSEIAIDLENHSYRSFQGFSCLMQLSTRDKDYVIDTIALRSHMGLLLDAFTDPHIVKVFHGCHSDILWLQRDFGLFVVNCFDTYQSSKLLKYPALSLAHLLKFYCGVTVNKKHQLADWRQRPLTTELLQYARDDTHYLLYIYDCLRRDVLREHGVEGLRAVFDASRKTCLNSYRKDEFDRLGYLQLFQDSRRNTLRLRAAALTAAQDSLLMCLWNWRDSHARRVDESPAFIMSNAELLRLGMIDQLPRTASELAQVGHPLSGYVLSKLDELLAAMRAAVFGEAPGDKTEDTRDTPAAKRKQGNSSSSGNNPSRSGFVSVRGQTSGVADRLRYVSSMHTFTPSIEPAPHAAALATGVPPLGSGRRMGLTRGTPSPSSEQHEEAELNDLLQRAGWVPHKGDANLEEAPRKPVTVCTFREPPNPRARAAYERACSLVSSAARAGAVLEDDSTGTDDDDDDGMQVQEEAAGLGGPVVSAATVAETAATRSEMKTSNLRATDLPNMTDLPQSLSEIYNLSNYNRKNRSRDRKRSRPAPEASDEGAAEDARERAEATYFNKDAPALSADGSIQEAASFLEKVNWIDGAGRDDLVSSFAGSEQEVPKLASHEPKEPETKKGMPQLKPSANPQIGKTNAGNKKPPLANPFLTYSSSDMAAIGASHSNRSSVGSSSGKKLNSSRDSAVGSSTGSAVSVSSSGGKERGEKQKQQQQQQQRGVERKKDQDKTHIFS